MKRFFSVFVLILALSFASLLFLPETNESLGLKTGEKLSNSPSVSGRTGTTEPRSVEVISAKEALRRSKERFKSLDTDYQRNQTFENPSSITDEIKRLERKLGLGTSFYSHVVNLFRDCSVPIEELFGIIENIESQKVKESAMGGVILKFGENDDRNLREIVDLSGLISHKVGQKIASQAFSTYVFSGKSGLLSERMTEVAGELSGQIFSKKAVDGITLEIARGLSSESDAKLFIDTFLINSDLGLMEDVSRQKSLFEKFEHGAAVGALNALVHQDDLNAEAAWILGKNSLAFSTEKVAHLSNSENEGIRAAFIEYEISSGNLSVARNMLKSSQLDSEIINAKLDWHFWNYQKDKLLGEMMVDPLQTVVNLTNGETAYDDYMLEAAVTSWITHDPNQAAEWVEANIDQMATDTRQYVAASYAKEAAAQGDMATDRQWANLIQDEKTLTRINGILKKAEEAASN